jgi:predicted glycosyltransferase
VEVTARDFGSTCELAKANGYSATVVGGGTGERLAGKLARSGMRSLALRGWATRQGPFDLAVSYNSYAQAVAARLCGIQFVTAMDYEFQPANRWCFMLARTILVPEGFDASTVASQRARARIRRHPGLKEHVYLGDWPIDVEGARSSLGLSEGESFFLVRSPADHALYHRFANDLFDDLLARLLQVRGTSTVVLTRTEEQQSRVQSKFEGEPSVLLPTGPLDGPSLIAGAAAVVSAGGTMAREAAVLGRPAFSIFQGRDAGVDSWLVSNGRLTRLRSSEEMDRIDWERLALGTGGAAPWVVKDARSTVVQALIDAVGLPKDR